MLIAKKSPAQIEFGCNCTASEGVGDAVYISGPAVGDFLQVRKGDITDIAKMPCVGLIKEKLSDTVGVMQSFGPLVMAGLTHGERYFVAYDGSISPNPPALGIVPRAVQEIGEAISGGLLYINPRGMTQLT